MGSNKMQYGEQLQIFQPFAPKKSNNFLVTIATLFLLAFWHLFLRLFTVCSAPCWLKQPAGKISRVLNLLTQNKTV
jgi:hypothetical protein